MRYGIIDNGNIGVYVAACASVQGLDVHFYGGNSLIQRIDVNSVKGDFSASDFKYYHDLNDFPSCEVLFLNINTLVDETMLGQLHQFVKFDGVLILFQKGVNYYESILKELPKCIIVGGLCWLKATKTSVTSVKHDFGETITIGVYNSHAEAVSLTIQQQLQSLIVLPFTGGRINFAIIDDFFSHLWTRYAFNMPYFILSVLHNKFSQEIPLEESLWQTAKEIRQEIYHVALAKKIAIQYEQIDSMDQALAAAVPSYPGLKLDYDHRLPLHLGDIFSGFLTMANNVQINVEKMQQSYAILLSLDRSGRPETASILRA